MVTTRSAGKVATPAQPSRSTRPSRLLNLNKKNVTRNAVAAHNLEQSPLLRLPPEIRNRINSYVLGGNNIHVSLDECHAIHGGRHGTKLKTWLTDCKCELTDKEMIAAIRNTEESFSVSDYIKHHSRCGMVPSPMDLPRLIRSRSLSLDLRLLQTCSQIYSESALIPFVANTFSFTTHDSLTDFIKHLVPKQQRAIRHVTFHSDYNGYRPGSVKKLTGLRDLAMFIGMWGFTAEIVASRATKPGFSNELVRDGACLAGKFEQLELTSVSVCAYQAAVRQGSLVFQMGHGKLGDAKALPKLFDTMLNEIERRLLEPYSRASHPPFNEIAESSKSLESDAAT